MLVMGIDPGINGALAVLWGNGATVYDVPTLQPKLGKRDYDITAMYEQMKRYRDADVCCYIEDVHSIPGDGHVGAFSFGRGVGIWHGLLTACGIPYKRVLPVTWKKFFGLYGIPDQEQRKDASRLKAIELFPELANRLRFKKDHDKAEALLIAEYGRQTL